MTIDDMSGNSRAETPAVAEKALNPRFIAMTGAIIAVIAIILAVAAATMAMTARGRKGGYATVRALRILAIPASGPD